MNKIHDLFYPIIMILRQEKEGNFNYKLQDRDVVIQTPEGEELLRIPASVFLVEAENASVSNWATLKTARSIWGASRSTTWSR